MARSTHLEHIRALGLLGLVDCQLNLGPVSRASQGCKINISALAYRPDATGLRSLYEQRNPRVCPRPVSEKCKSKENRFCRVAS